MENYLWLLQLGATVPGRLTEQHDVFIDIAPNLASMSTSIKNFWRGCKSIHLDGFERIEYADGHKITVVPAQMEKSQSLNLFFINLGGYRVNSAVEWHHQILVVAENMAEAIRKAKKSDFYKSMSVPGGPSHIDNRYGIAIDEVFNVNDILPPFTRSSFNLIIEPVTAENILPNRAGAGYFKLNELGNCEL